MVKTRSGKDTMDSQSDGQGQVSSVPVPGQEGAHEVTGGGEETSTGMHELEAWTGQEQIVQGDFSSGDGSVPPPTGSRPDVSTSGSREFAVSTMLRMLVEEGALQERRMRADRLEREQ